MQVEVEQLRRELERLTAIAGQGNGLLDALLHHAPHGIIVCDATGKLTVQNAAAERIWRGSASTASSHDWAQYQLFDRDGNPLALDEWPLARSLRGEMVEQIEVRVIKFDGTRGVLLGSTAPIRNAAGAIEGALLIFADITDLRAITESEHEARRRIARLQHITSALSEARTSRDVAALVSRDISDVLGASKAVIGLPDGGDLVIAASGGLTAAAPSRFPVTARVPTAVAYRQGAVWCATAEAARREFPDCDFGTTQAVASLPIVVAGKPVGAVGFGFDRPQPFTADERELINDVTHQVALALERARLYDVATRRSREMELLFRLAQATAGAATLAELYERVLVGLTELLAVERASILLFDHADVMRFVAWRGLSESYRRAVDGHSPWRPDSPGPAPLFVVDAERDEEMASYRAVFAAEGIRSLGFIPLVHDRRVIGKLMIYGAEPRSFTAEDSQLAMTLAATVAQAVMRARAVEAERATVRRLELLARASRPLVESGLDQHGLLSTFASALARAFDGGVAITLVGDDGISLVPVGWFHPNVDAGDMLAEVTRSLELRVGAGPHGAVVATGKSILVPSIDPAEVVERAVPAMSTFLTRYPVHAMLTVPLRAGDRVIGTLQALRIHAGQTFTGDDLRIFEDLAERVALAVSNARLFARIEESNRSRDDILAVVSHDLRAPLASIVMAAGASPREPAHLERQFSIIKRNADQMARLISDLLDFASIQAGRLAVERSWFTADQIATTVFEMFAAAAAERLVILTPPTLDPIELCTDRDRLIQALGNLVSNAVKLTPAGGRIDITAEVTSRTVKFAVRDDGPGIAPEDQPHVFERYWRGAKTSYRGHGLGLAIAKGIAEALGGHLSVISELGRGSTFSISVPR
jgi:PAS domain S-box-containing protein